MAVITPSSVAGLFGSTAQRSPHQGRKVIDSGAETEAQRLARESNERIAAQSSKDRTAALITNSVLQFSNMALQAGLEGWKIGQDPAAVRSQVAQAEMLQDKAAEIEGSIGMEPLAPLSPQAPIPEVPGGASTGGPPTAQREPISIPQGALDGLMQSMPGISAKYAEGTNERRDLRTQLAKLPEVDGDAHAERIIASFLGQGEFIQKNHQAMISSGALTVPPGAGAGYWSDTTKKMNTPGWSSEYKVAQTLRPDAQADGRADYMGKLAAVREKVQDEDLLAKVVDQVVGSPAGPALLEEAAVMSPGRDWGAIAEAVKKGDRGPAIDALMEALSMTPDQLRDATPVEGMERAMSFFGPEGEPRIALTDSIRDLKKAAHALEAAGKDDLAAKLRTKEAWGRTHDWESVVPGAVANRPDAGVGAFYDEGEAKRGMDPRARAKAFYDIATGEAELKTKEMTAKAKLARATRSVSRNEHINHKAHTDPLAEDDWKESWRGRPEYQRILEAVGSEEAERVLHQQWRNKKQNFLYKRYIELGKVAESEGAEAKAADEAAATAKKAATKNKQKLLTQKRQFEKDVRDRKTDLKKALSQWGVSAGGKVSAEKWVAKKLSQENLSAGKMKKRRTALLREARAGVVAANAEIATAIQAVKDAEASKAAFLNTFEK